MNTLFFVFVHFCLDIHIYVIAVYTNLVRDMSEEKEVKEVETECKKLGKKSSEEIGELMAIREMINEWLEKLGIVSKDIVNAVVSTLDGSKLGKEIVDLYNSLKSAGLPENLVVEIVKDFYKKKLEIAPSLSDIVKSVSEVRGSIKPPGSPTISVPTAKKEIKEKKESEKLEEK